MSTVRTKHGPDCRIKREPEKYRPGYGARIMGPCLTRWYPCRKGKYRHMRMN